jgi:hypothetical protein
MPCSIITLEKLLVTQLAKTLSNLCGTWRFITMFTSVCLWALLWTILMHSTPSPLFLNIILKSMPTSLKWSLPFRFTDQIFQYLSSFICTKHDPSISSACFFSSHIMRLLIRSFIFYKHLFLVSFRLSQRCSWGLCSSGVWLCITG